MEGSYQKYVKAVDVQWREVAGDRERWRQICL